MLSECCKRIDDVFRFHGSQTIEMSSECQ
jgi:hypothetical protein